MKNLVFLLLLLPSFMGLTTAVAATTVGATTIAATIDVVPESIQFAGITIKLDKEAREKVQNRVNTLQGDTYHFNQFLERGNLYFPLIEKVLEQENIPKDFKYLALQESMLLPNAVTRGNSVGFWQLKDFTARDAGLRIDSRIDERKHVMAATYSASQYLKKNNYYIKNWLFTLLSYRLGLTGTNNVIDRDFIGANQITLGEDIHNYLTNFLAYKLALEGEVNKAYRPSVKLFEFELAFGRNINDLAQLTKLNYKDLVNHNQWILIESVPQKSKYAFLLPVPVSRENEFIQKFDLVRPESLLSTINENKIRLEEKGKATTTTTSSQTIANNTAKTEEQPVQNTPTYPIIKNKKARKIGSETIQVCTANDIPAFIAGKHKNTFTVLDALDISDSKFRKINEMSRFEELIPGQVYYLKNKKSKGPVAEHVASRNQSLWQVAQKYGMKLKNLRKYNIMTPTEDLVAGRVLLLQKKRSKKSKPEFRDVKPEKKTGNLLTGNNGGKKDNNVINISPDKKKDDKKQDANSRFHIVQKGETILSIARDRSITPMNIQEWNGLSSNSTLTEGQILIVKGSKTAAAKDENVISPNNTGGLDNKSPFNIKIDDDGNPIGQTTASSNPNKNGNQDTRGTSTSTSQGEKQFKEVYHKVQRGETLYRISRKFNVSQDQIIAWNQLPNPYVRPGTRLKILQPNTGEINLSDVEPINSGNGNPTKEENVSDERLESEASGNTSAGTNSVATHKVTSGETLYGIARQYGIKFNDLIAWNNLSKSSPIYVNQVLTVSSPTSSSGRVESSSSGSTPEGYHVIQQGEQIYDIASRYNISTEEIRKWNNLSPTAPLTTGDQLIVNRSLAQNTVMALDKRSSSTANSSSPQAIYHTVKKNETLYRIALSNKVKVDDIQKWNDITSTSISVGQKLIVGYRNASASNQRVSSNVSQASTSLPNVSRASSTNRGSYLPPSNNTTTSASRTASVASSTYKVKKGDTLYSISRRVGKSVDEIKRLNGKTSNSIRVGEELKVQ